MFEFDFEDLLKSGKTEQDGCVIISADSLEEMQELLDDANEDEDEEEQQVGGASQCGGGRFFEQSQELMTRGGSTPSPSAKLN